MARPEELVVTSLFSTHILRHLKILSPEFRSRLLGSGFSEEEILHSMNIPGSKFLSSVLSDPFEILELLSNQSNYNEIKQANDTTVLCFDFNFDLGEEAIISINELNNEMQSRIFKKNRNGVMVNVVKMKSLPLTNKLVLVINSNQEIITAFPGRYATPLPYLHFSEDERIQYSTFWVSHVFIELINE